MTNTITKLIGAGLIGLTLVAATPAVAGAAEDTPKSERACDKDAWPADVQGKPEQLMPGATGVFLWHDGNDSNGNNKDDSGWSLRATEAGKDKAVFSGSIVADKGRIHSVARRTEGRDKVTHTAKRHGVAFRFTNFGGIDGLDFRVNCASTLRITLKQDGRLISEGLVFLGHDGHHPNKVPFAIER